MNITYVLLICCFICQNSGSTTLGDSTVVLSLAFSSLLCLLVKKKNADLLFTILEDTLQILMAENYDVSYSKVVSVLEFTILLAFPLIVI